jgi:hypothetical protein
MEVRVHTSLRDVESAQLDMWLSAHAADVDRVEIHASYVSVDGAHSTLKAKASATATRHSGQLAQALNEALDRLRTEDGGS